MAAQKGCAREMKLSKSRSAITRVPLSWSITEGVERASTLCTVQPGSQFGQGLGSSRKAARHGGTSKQAGLLWQQFSLTHLDSQYSGLESIDQISDFSSGRRPHRKWFDHQPLDHLLGGKQVGLQPVACAEEEVVNLGAQLALVVVVPAVERSSDASGRKPAVGQDLCVENGVIWRILCGEHEVSLWRFFNEEGKQEPGPVPGAHSGSRM